jgi:hypothetical protein
MHVWMDEIQFSLSYNFCVHKQWKFMCSICFDLFPASAETCIFSGPLTYPSTGNAVRLPQPAPTRWGGGGGWVSAWCEPAVPNRQHCCCASHVLLSFWEGRPARGRGEAGVRSLMSKMGLRWATTSLRWIIDWFVSLWWLIPMPLWVLCIHGWMLGGS